MSLLISPKEFASKIVDTLNQDKDKYKSLTDKAPVTLVLVDFISSSSRVLFCEKPKDLSQSYGNKVFECAIKAPAQSAETKVLCVSIKGFSEVPFTQNLYRQLNVENLDAFATQIIEIMQGKLTPSE
jgi:hypothetical protein